MRVRVYGRMGKEEEEGGRAREATGGGWAGLWIVNGLLLLEYKETRGGALFRSSRCGAGWVVNSKSDVGAISEVAAPEVLRRALSGDPFWSRRVVSIRV